MHLSAGCIRRPNNCITNLSFTVLRPIEGPTDHFAYRCSNPGFITVKLWNIRKQLSWFHGICLICGPGYSRCTARLVLRPTSHQYPHVGRCTGNRKICGRIETYLFMSIRNMEITSKLRPLKSHNSQCAHFEISLRWTYSFEITRTIDHRQLPIFYPFNGIIVSHTTGNHS